LDKSLSNKLKKNQFENDQVTYQVLVNIHFGRRVDQTSKVPNKVTIPISRPQTIYKTPIMMTQANRSMGWPPPIPLNCERQRIGLVVDPRARGLMAKPY
jgi:hypothetical protein